jgi:hypothetical protein
MMALSSPMVADMKTRRGHSEKVGIMSTSGRTGVITNASWLTRQWQ